MGMKVKPGAGAQAPANTDDFAATEPLEHSLWRDAVDRFFTNLCVPDVTLQGRGKLYGAAWLEATTALRDEVRRRVALPEPAHWIDVAAMACRLRLLIDDLIARDYLPQRPATTWRMPAGEAPKPKAKPKRTVSLADAVKQAGVA